MFINPLAGLLRPLYKILYSYYLAFLFHLYLSRGGADGEKERKFLATVQQNEFLEVKIERSQAVE